MLFYYLIQLNYMKKKRRNSSDQKVILKLRLKLAQSILIVNLYYLYIVMKNTCKIHLATFLQLMHYMECICIH